jgi:hypothetical protein
LLSAKCELEAGREKKLNLKHEVTCFKLITKLQISSYRQLPNDQSPITKQFQISILKHQLSR